MSPAARQRYLQQMRDRYAVARLAVRSALLDEAVAMMGYHRKALIRRFTRPLSPRLCAVEGGRGAMGRR